MAFRIFKTKTYEEDYQRLDHREQLRVDELVRELFEKGDSIGKPLGIPFFREKKFEGKRLLYLVYKTHIVILLVAIANKKTQQATINEILAQLDAYKVYVEEQLKRIT